MKKILRAFLVLLVGLLFAQPVNAEFYSSATSLKFDTGSKWVEAGTTYTYKSLFIYRCAGGSNYKKYGLYPGSLDPGTDKSKFRCDDGQTPSIVNRSNECHSNNACVSGRDYFCFVTYDITCPPRKTTTTTTTQAPSTKTTTRSKTTSGGGNKTTKKTTQQPITEAPTVPTTEITTEETTGETISNNANIKSITVNTKSIGYKSSKDEYRFKIAYGIKSVAVEVELEDNKAKVEITGNDSLDDENREDVIKIVVTAEDGTTTKEVRIIAEKFKPSETDCTLANIYVKDYAINYEKNTFDYSVTLGKDVTSLDIETVQQYDTQIVNVTGNEKLKNKSNIVIEVESPSGEICTYTIKVKKNSSVGKYIVIIVVLLIALGVAGYFLYRYINKSNGLYKYE